MLESNATLEASTLMAILNTTDFQVTDTNGVSHSVTIEQNELVAGMTELHIYCVQMEDPFLASSCDQIFTHWQLHMPHYPIYFHSNQLL